MLRLQLKKVATITTFFIYLYTILFNTISIISLVIFSLITKNQMIIISGVLLIILTYLIIMFILEFNEFKMDFRVFRSIKYDSVDALDSVLFFFIYFFGLSNASLYFRNLKFNFMTYLIRFNNSVDYHLIIQNL